MICLWYGEGRVGWGGGANNVQVYFYTHVMLRYCTFLLHLHTHVMLRYCTFLLHFHTHVMLRYCTFLLHLHTHVMLRYCTFLLHFHTHVMLRYCTFLLHFHTHVMLRYCTFLLHFHTHVMLRYCTFLLHLHTHTHVMLRYCSFLLHLHTRTSCYKGAHKSWIGLGCGWKKSCHMPWKTEMTKSLIPVCGNTYTSSSTDITRKTRNPSCSGWKTSFAYFCSSGPGMMIHTKHCKY